MGYTTTFEGQFTFNKPLDEETFAFLTKFSQTRRMKRNLGLEYGVEGEFFVDGLGYMGQDETPDVIDENEPPATQPGLWCQWRPTEDRQHLKWSRMEKFYDYIEWLEYIISKITAPRGYILDGKVTWQGEDEQDKGFLIVINNEVSTKHYY